MHPHGARDGDGQVRKHGSAIASGGQRHAPDKLYPQKKNTDARLKKPPRTLALRFEKSRATEEGGTWNAASTPRKLCTPWRCAVIARDSKTGRGGRTGNSKLRRSTSQRTTPNPAGTECTYGRKDGTLRSFGDNRVQATLRLYGVYRFAAADRPRAYEPPPSTLGKERKNPWSDCRLRAPPRDAGTPGKRRRHAFSPTFSGISRGGNSDSKM